MARGRPPKVDDDDIVAAVRPLPQPGRLPSTSEVTESVNKQNASDYDRKTIYRRLDDLENEGEISKIEVGEGRGMSVGWYVPGSFSVDDARPQSESGGSNADLPLASPGNNRPEADRPEGPNLHPRTHSLFELGAALGIATAFAEFLAFILWIFQPLFGILAVHQEAVALSFILGGLGFAFLLLSAIVGIVGVANESIHDVSAGRSAVPLAIDMMWRHPVRTVRSPGREGAA